MKNFFNELKAFFKEEIIPNKKVILIISMIIIISFLINLNHKKMIDDVINEYIKVTQIESK